MTLLIAVLLLAHMDAEWWAYVGAVWLWAIHTAAAYGELLVVLAEGDE